jgi:hypothetical protein
MKQAISKMKRKDLAQMKVCPKLTIVREETDEMNTEHPIHPCLFNPGSGGNKIVPGNGGSPNECQPGSGGRD